MKRIHFYLFLTIAALGMLATEVLAVTIYPITAGYAVSENGFNTLLSSSIDNDSMEVYYFSPEAEARGILEFNISGIASSATVVSAELFLYADAADENIGLHGYEGNGTIELSDFQVNNQLLSFDPGIGPNFISGLFLTNYIQGLIGQNVQFLGIQLREIAVDYNFFYGINGTPVEFRPRLVVEITDASSVPEPSTLLLLCVGLVGLAGAARMKVKK